MNYMLSKTMIRGTIEITRSNLRFNKFRGYSIIIDDKKAVSIENNKTISLPVDSGRHSVHARVDLFQSNRVQFEIAPGQNLRFVIGDRKITSLQHGAFFIFIWFCVLLGFTVGIVAIIILAPVAGIIYGLTIGKPNIQQMLDSNTGT